MLMILSFFKMHLIKERKGKQQTGQELFMLNLFRGVEETEGVPLTATTPERFLGLI